MKSVELVHDTIAPLVGCPTCGQYVGRHCDEKNELDHKTRAARSQFRPGVNHPLIDCVPDEEEEHIPSRDGVAMDHD